MAAIAGERDLITTEQLPAMPDDGIDRELYAGQLRELGTSRRGVRHTWSGTNVTAMLRGWVKTQPVPRGRVLSGDAGFRLRRNPDTTVGVDIAYISPQMAADLPDEAFLIDGAPVLAVEILSPSDVQGNIVTKVVSTIQTSATPADDVQRHPTAGRRPAPAGLRGRRDRGVRGLTRWDARPAAEAPDVHPATSTYPASGSRIVREVTRSRGDASRGQYVLRQLTRHLAGFDVPPRQQGPSSRALADNPLPALADV
jgi:hypothetical protein